MSVIGWTVVGGGGESRFLLLRQQSSNHVRGEQSPSLPVGFAGESPCSPPDSILLKSPSLDSHSFMAGKHQQEKGGKKGQGRVISASHLRPQTQETGKRLITMQNVFKYNDLAH